MKQKAFSIIAAIYVIISCVTLTSCRETIGDIADGLVNGIANERIEALLGDELFLISEKLFKQW